MISNDSSHQSCTGATRGNQRAFRVLPFLVMGLFVTLAFAAASVANEHAAQEPL